MSTHEKLPEDARKEPKIRSPEEEHERAAKRRRIAEGRHVPSEPDEPLRQPGELSEPPPDVPPEHR